MKKYSFRVPRLLIIPVLLFLIIFAIIWFKATSDQPLFLMLGALILVTSFGTGIYTLITGKQPETITEDQSKKKGDENQYTNKQILSLVITFLVTLILTSGAWIYFYKKSLNNLQDVTKSYNACSQNLEGACQSIPTTPQIFSDFLISPAGNYVAVTENNDLGGYFDGRLIFYSNKGKEVKRFTLYELKKLWVKESLDNLFIIGLDQWSADGSILTGSLINGYGFLGMSYYFQINTKDWSIEKSDLMTEENNLYFMGSKLNAN